MLDWSLIEMSKAAGVSVSSIHRMEKARPQVISDIKRVLVRKALEGAGVTFLADVGSGAGMTVRPS